MTNSAWLEIGICIGVSIILFAGFVWSQIKNRKNDEIILAQKDQIDEQKIEAIVNSESRDEHIKYLESTDDPKSKS